MKWLTERLVANWRDCWRWWSVQAHVLCTLLAGLLVMVPTMPAEVQALIPPKWRAVGVALWLIAGVLLRLIEQRKPPAERP